MGMTRTRAPYDVVASGQPGSTANGEGDEGDRQPQPHAPRTPEPPVREEDTRKRLTSGSRTPRSECRTRGVSAGPEEWVPAPAVAGTSGAVLEEKVAGSCHTGCDRLPAMSPGLSALSATIAYVESGSVGYVPLTRGNRLSAHRTRGQVRLSSAGGGVRAR